VCTRVRVCVRVRAVGRAQSSGQGWLHVHPPMSSDHLYSRVSGTDRCNADGTAKLNLHKVAL
jgi:hypothetical protein